MRASSQVLITGSVQFNTRRTLTFFASKGLVVSSPSYNLSVNGLSVSTLGPQQQHFQSLVTRLPYSPKLSVLYTLFSDPIMAGIFFFIKNHFLAQTIFFLILESSREVSAKQGA